MEFFEFNSNNFIFKGICFACVFISTQVLQNDEGKYFHFVAAVAGKNIQIHFSCLPAYRERLDNVCFHFGKD